MITCTNGKRIISVPSEHYSNVLSKQGWSICEDKNKETEVEQSEEVVAPITKNKFGRPKKQDI